MPPPRRVTVMSPRTAAALRRRRSAPRALPGEAAQAWDYLGVWTLIRAQLRLAVQISGVFMLVMGGLPAMFALFPVTRTARVLGLPLPWFVLGVAVFPAMVFAGWVYVRLAERNERDYVELGEAP